MSELTLKIEGMSCGHCVMSVKKAIDGVTGVSSSNVEVGKAAVTYDEARTSKENIAKAIRDAGYKVIG